MEIIRKSMAPLGLFGRRGFLTGVGATLLGTALAPSRFHVRLRRRVLATTRSRWASPLAIRRPMASCLWTRLAPKPLEGGGMPQQPVAVQWRIATDERMRRIVQRGAVLAVPELGHSVHVEVDGLRPGRWYWYQFKVGNEYSPIGRTRTAPRARLRRATAASPSSRASTTRRLLLRAQAPGGGESRLRRPSRRLHLRGAVDERDRPPAPARPRDHVDRGLPDPLRAVQVRIRTCRPCTRRFRGSSPGTITRPRTTTPA